jgi:branched-chain amino acid transport system permease protein
MSLAAQVATLTSKLSRYRKWWLLLLLGLAVAYPLFVRPYFLSLALEVLIYAIFAMSLDLLLGYTGLASLGHSAFFGIGAYLVAYLSSRNDLALRLTSNLLVTLPIVAAGSGLSALVIGFFALRTRGIYFLMVTLAIGQMLFSIAISWARVTGGSDGLTGVPRPSIELGPLSYVFDSRESFYYLTLALFLGVLWLLRRIVSSPFGWTLRGIRENEARLSALVDHPLQHTMQSYVIAGAIAGLAGAMLAHDFGIASPDSLYWTTSGQVLIMLIVGGTGTLNGPVMGAAVVRLLRNLLSSYTERWETLVGLVFILFVIFAPRGLIGLLGGQRERLE